MKKFKVSFIAGFICLAIFAFQANATSTVPTVPADPETPTTQTITTNTALNRVMEIQAMDKSHLSASEKKALRKELKTIKKQAQISNSGIYISASTLLLIIILLIILV